MNPLNYAYFWCCIVHMTLFLLKENEVDSNMFY